MIVTYQNTGIPGCLPPRSTPYKTGSSPHEKNAGAEKCVLFVSASEKTKNTAQDLNKSLLPGFRFQKLHVVSESTDAVLIFVPFSSA